MAWREINNISLSYPLEFGTSGQIAQTNCTLFEEDLYSSNRHKNLDDLKISLGSNELPRFACSAHKMNIAVRKAILSHKPLSNMLSALSKFSASVKKSVNLSKIHLSKKCCLRCENATRRGSSFLMLWSYIKAYKAGAFDGDHKCPYSLEKIELYFQILKPVYCFNLYVQKSTLSIYEVLPFIMTLIHSSLARMALVGDGS